MDSEVLNRLAREDIDLIQYGIFTATFCCVHAVSGQAPTSPVDHPQQLPDSCHGIVARICSICKH